MRQTRTSHYYPLACVQTLVAESRRIAVAAAENYKTNIVLLTAPVRTVSANIIVVGCAASARNTRQHAQPAAVEQPQCLDSRT